ncbi:snRNA-activating protein complex subunit 4 [Trichinella zimbabwensis]|uniref:snRNA-activating protein complex subunit 4 n=1 Tax=Trichinella zimbabwensis TaxID=268475 RepID=A0A0V1H8J9_9BILA|nr:snRNA-activating protein complex subunit 4 [Trichinella zimbabwensis]
MDDEQLINDFNLIEDLFSNFSANQVQPNESHLEEFNFTLDADNDNITDLTLRDLGVSSNDDFLKELDSSRLADTQEKLSEIKDDVENEEILHYLTSGEFPADWKTALALNNSYQEVLNAFIKKAENMYREVDQQLRDISDKLYKKYGRNSVMSTFRPVNYSHPYFSDSNRFTPARNKDAERKLQNNEPDMLVKPAQPWSDVAVEVLQKCVRKQVEHSLKKEITNRKTVINATLNYLKKHNTTDSSPESQQQTMEEMHSLQCELELLDQELLKIDDSTVEQHLGNIAFLNDLDWTEVSQSVSLKQSRSAAECRQAWLNQFAFWINRSEWTSEEVEKLTTLAEQNEGKNWNHIARELQTNRTGFACLQKYQELVYKTHGYNKWEEEEDKLLLEIIDSFRVGNVIQWRAVGYFFEHRTLLQCKQRYEYIKPGNKKGRWNAEEKLLLYWAVRTHGPKNWRRVAEMVPGRNALQCRDQFLNILDCSIRIEQWTKAEDEIILSMTAKEGNRYALISRVLPGRTPNQVKMRHRILINSKDKVRGKIGWFIFHAHWNDISFIKSGKIITFDFHFHCRIVAYIVYWLFPFQRRLFNNLAVKRRLRSVRRNRNAIWSLHERCSGADVPKPMLEMMKAKYLRMMPKEKREELLKASERFRKAIIIQDGDNSEDDERNETQQLKIHPQQTHQLEIQQLQTEQPQTDQAEVSVVVRKRGRPKGAKNKKTVIGETRVQPKRTARSGVNNVVKFYQSLEAEDD